MGAVKIGAGAVQCTRIIVIHGPPASGKTRNSWRFLEHYGCTRVVEEWDLRGSYRQREKPRIGDLVLTQRGPDYIRKNLGPDALPVPIELALMAIGGSL